LTGDMPTEERVRALREEDVPEPTEPDSEEDSE
jgi:hypothetical protein